MAGALTLLEYLPNYPGSSPACSYDGAQIVRLKREIGSGEVFQGYAVPYRDYRLRERVVALFAKASKLFVDVGTGAVELLPRSATTTGMALWREVRVDTSNGSLLLQVFTPPHRYLLNDGRFPEDVEPIIHLLRQLTDESCRHRYIRKFSTGYWGENGN